MGAMNIRGLTLGLLMVTAILAISLFTTSQASAQTPPVVTAPADLTVEAESSAGTPATNAAIAAFLEAGTAQDELGVTVPVTAVSPSELFPLGSTPVTFSATDSESNTGTAQATVTVVDTTPPALIVPADLTVAAAGQSGANVVVPEATASDTVDLAPLVGCTPSSGLFPQGTTLVSCTAIDASGNSSTGSFTVTIVDTTAPSITTSVEPVPNAAGWNNTDVTVTFTCIDNESSIFTCEGGQTLTADGAEQSVEGSATDLEGNIATLIVDGINIDKTAPTVTITSPAQDAMFLSTDNVLAVWGAADALSGIASSGGTVQSNLPIDTSVPGQNQFTVTATDDAGNTASVTHSYAVLVPFSLFDIEGGELELEQGAATDEFEVEGSFELASTSNGIDLLNESVTVTFDGFTETIPPGSFVRDTDAEQFEFSGASGGITQASINDDGSFRVEGKGLDLGSIITTNPVFFSLRIGDYLGQTTILFGVEPFDLQVREAKDLFGTVVSVTVLSEGQGVLVINTKDGFVDVLTDEDTSFKLPRNRDARIDDLVEGDLVAVSLEEEDGVLVADKVFLVPGKTQHRHVPGVIVTLIVGEQITIQPPGAAAEQVTFNIADQTKINLRGRVDELNEGLFVVVLAARDPLTGDISPEALEINVTSGKPKLKSRDAGDGPDEVADDGDVGDIDDGDVGDIDDGDVGDIDDGDVKDRNTAEIQGVLGLDALGNWTINGIVVALDPDTEIEGGLVVGQSVEVEGVLQEDGTILAREVESSDDDTVVSNKTELTGIFQGIDPVTGHWIISGNLVAVGPGTDTDGLPSEGQRIKLEALVQEDGTLLAREIEKKGGSTDEDDGFSEVKLEGTFLGVDADGRWNVNGASVLLDPLTRLKGALAVGERVKVKALLQEDGSFLAVKIEGKAQGKSRSSNKAEVRGTIDDILDDGTLVIDGIPVSLSVLTDLDIDPQIGDSVKVEASLQADGSLIAKEVELERESDAEGVSEPSEAEIQGIIESVNPDGSLVVNGITVSIDADAEIKGNLVEGAEVKLEGFLQENGTLLAQGLKVRGRQATASGTERKVAGLVEEILHDQDGNIVAIIVDGETISVEALTEFEGQLGVGTSVEVEGLEIDGQFLAGKVVGEEDTGQATAEEAREKGKAKAEEKAEKAREREEDKAERKRERDEESDGDSSGNGSDGDSSGSGFDGNNSGRGSDGNNSGRGSDGDSSGRGSDGDNSGRGSDGDSSGRGSDGDNSGRGSDGNNSGRGSDGDNSGRGSDGNNSGRGSDGNNSGGESDGGREDDDDD